MAREEHQPSTELVKRPERSSEEMLSICGQSIAFIMAYGQDRAFGGAEISSAIVAARHAQVAAVFVLADGDHAMMAIEAARKAGHKGRTMIQAVEYDPVAAVGPTRDAGDLELFDLPFGLVETTHVIAESVLDTYESVVIMDAAQANITADHLYELCLDVRERNVDVVASWIQCLRRPPIVLTRDFLEELGSSDYAQPAGSMPEDAVSFPMNALKNETVCRTGAHMNMPVRAVPRIRTYDHVFGEEELAASHVSPAVVESFLGKCSLSALQAVSSVRDAGIRSSEEPRSEAHPNTPRLANESPALNNAEALLVKTAGEVVKAGDAYAADEADELAWADAFGRRNKRDFPLLNDEKFADTFAYLDSAATAQRVEAALRAQREFDERENANVYRGVYELSERATISLDNARQRLEDFIGAQRRQTVLTANTTMATNLVALAWGEHNIKRGDLIVCEQASHHSNALPFLMLAQRKGARVEYVPFDEWGRLDVNAYARLMEKGPKLVCFAHVGNVFGIEAPVKQLAAAAHEVGARVLVDAAQSFPHLKIDVANMGADWVAFSAHKAYGPLGVGALWISPAAFDEMDPLGGGGGSVSHVGEQSYYLRPQALQYELGTPPVSQMVGWAAAIEYLDGLGMENVARHGAALTRYAAQGLQRIDGVNVVGDHARADGQNGLVSFAVRSVAPADTARFLGRLGVAIRSGGHCSLPLHAALGMVGTGRLSIAVHTTREDVDAALAAIALCRQAHES